MNLQCGAPVMGSPWEGPEKVPLPSIEAIEVMVSQVGCKLLQPMHYINPGTVRRWINWSDFFVPSAVNTVCPHCKKASSLTIEPLAEPDQHKAIISNGYCVLCNERSKIWIIGASRKGSREGCKEIWMLPKPPGTREISISEGGNLPGGIFNAYKEAVGCFNSGFWRPTVTECNRALEGITQDKFEKEERKNLQITPELKQLKQYKLFEPILELASAIRLVRYYSAHFHPTKEPDREAATEVLDLTEYLIRYFYVLPFKITELENKFNEIGGPELTKETST